MSRPRNVVVAQSGGPTAVINNTLRGIVETCREMPDVFGAVYAGWHGIEGVLREELLDLSAQPAEEIALLGVTPGAGAIGTSRYKLQSNHTEDFGRILDVLRAHDAGCFFYIGGNGSMLTANTLAKRAAKAGLDLVVTGAPKTIDNDVGDSERKLVDHTPGYGSIARYWAFKVQEANEENAGMSTTYPVLVMQAMGRKIGYIPAAARLADPERRMPLQIYLAGAEVSLEELAGNVNDELGRSGRCLVAVSEGFDAGDVGDYRDNRGQVVYGASKSSAAQRVINYLNEKGLAARGAAWANVPAADQRSSIAYASTVDLEEAYRAGQKAVLIAAEGVSGYMSTILRRPGPAYSPYYDKALLEQVAGSERRFPAAWIASNRRDVTDDFIRYARPLIGDNWPAIPLIDGRIRFARLQPLFARQELPAYQPQAWRA